MTVVLCRTKSGKDTGIRFGGFLLYEGEIGKHDLERALRYQMEEYVALGTLAVREKCLSERQLCDIKGYQRARGGLFGDIAIELGFLNEVEVDALLKIQDEKHIKIGEILVLFGVINRENMELRLQDFHELARAE